MSSFMEDRTSWIVFLVVIIPAGIFISYLIIDAVLDWLRKRRWFIR